jgi:hypothetical protein
MTRSSEPGRAADPRLRWRSVHRDWLSAVTDWERLRYLDPI